MSFGGVSPVCSAAALCLASRCRTEGGRREALGTELLAYLGRRSIDVIMALSVLAMIRRRVDRLITIQIDLPVPLLESAAGGSTCLKPPSPRP